MAESDMDELRETEHWLIEHANDLKTARARFEALMNAGPPEYTSLCIRKIAYIDEQLAAVFRQVRQVQTDMLDGERA